MRKADYTALAEIIRADRADALAMRERALSESRRMFAEGRDEALQHLAQQFASRASVDRAAFLTACGITP